MTSRLGVSTNLNPKRNVVYLKKKFPSKEKKRETEKQISWKKRKRKKRIRSGLYLAHVANLLAMFAGPFVCSLLAQSFGLLLALFVGLCLFLAHY
jgi:hypothetical protein